FCKFLFQIALTAVGILFLVGLVNPWLLLPILFLSIVFVNLRQFYLKTARDVKRLEATSELLSCDMLFALD
ncbi:Multidrug resistance protein 2 atp-binding cassette protein c, partial [Daphnia magna]